MDLLTLPLNPTLERVADAAAFLYLRTKFKRYMIYYSDDI